MRVEEMLFLSLNFNNKQKEGGRRKGNNKIPHKGISQPVRKVPLIQDNRNSNSNYAQKKIFMCQLSPVTCHISPTPTVTATDPPPANSPTLHSRMVHQDRNPRLKNILKPKQGGLESSGQRLISSIG